MSVPVKDKRSGLGVFCCSPLQFLTQVPELQPSQPDCVVGDLPGSTCLSPPGLELQVSMSFLGTSVGPGDLNLASMLVWHAFYSLGYVFSNFRQCPACEFFFPDA